MLANAPRKTGGHSSVCPWWLGGLLDNPVRRLLQPPTPLLQPFVKPGDACLDIGCGTGYLTIPLAEIAGPAGRVTAVDVQPKMLAAVQRRARRHDVAAVVAMCTPDDPAWRVPHAYDFILVFWMLHEVPDQRAFLVALRALLKPGGRLLLAEPRLHVRVRRWDAQVTTARDAGFVVRGGPRVAFSRSAILE